MWRRSRRWHGARILGLSAALAAAMHLERRVQPEQSAPAIRVLFVVGAFELLPQLRLSSPGRSEGPGD